MPNHFLVIGLCGRDYEACDEKGVDSYDIDFTPINGANLCQLACPPLPAELEGIAACYPPCRYRNKETGEFSKDCDLPWGDVTDKWERVELTEEEIASLQERYNAVNWYDWNRNNWGTKWGTYSTKVHTLGGDGSPIMIEFQSSWGPPNATAMAAITKYLEETYCLKNIRWIGHDPYDNDVIEIEVDSDEVDSTPSATS